MKHDEKPAFPPNAGWIDNDVQGRGMTLREYYAGLAMQGYIAHGDTNIYQDGSIARRAVDQADTLIAILQREDSVAANP